MKILNGAELADYIKARQAKQIRGLRQAHNVFPRLAVIQTSTDPVIDMYVRIKKSYAEDILVDVDHYQVDEATALVKITELNDDDSVHGIIVQLPLGDATKTDELLKAVSPAKDVDALGSNKYFDPATPMAINWLLTGYNIDLANKKILVVGKGRLVGAPLIRLWQESGYDVTGIDETVIDIRPQVMSADIVVTAVGSPGLITSDMLKPETVVVDAGTSTDNGRVVGDLADDVRERHDLVLTPKKGGVGPLTVCALFDNVIRSARRTVETES